ARPAELNAHPPPDAERVLLEQDRGPKEGDEHRSADVEALSPSFEIVAHLVYEDEQDEAHREPPAPDPGVGGDRHEHRGRGGEQLELEDRGGGELELPEQN